MSKPKPTTAAAPHQPYASPAARATAAAAAAAQADLIDAVISYVVSIHPELGTQRDDMTEALRAEFGGQRWYVSARPETDRQRKARQVLETFNGRNAREVARTLQISRATVYRILKQPGRMLPALGAAEANDTTTPTTNPQA
jgi:plasmid stabilization system protein ParE